MPVFVLFVFGAIILGAGAMLSPAWPTAQPRIGLSATFSLALVVGGTIFYASLFGWETLVIDYLMFALMTGIFLGGTLSIGQTRAEARGEELLDEDQGWPGPQDLSVLGVIALVLSLAAVVLPVPFGDSAQSYGLMALAMRDGETLNTLAPYLPDVQYLHAPGFNALTAYLSQQLNAGIHTVQFAAAVVIAFMNIWLAYDFGAEIGDKRLGRTMALVMLAGLGLFGLLVNGYFPALMGLAFAQASLIYTFRYLRHRYPVDLVGAGLMMGAVLISDLGVFVLLLLGFIAWMATIWLSTERPPMQTWLMLAFVAPVIALAATAPWLADTWPLLTGTYTSPYARSIDHIYVMFGHNGLWMWALGLGGMWLGWQKRDMLTLFCAAWLLLIFDFAVSGGIAALLPFLTTYLDPYALAWYGPIIPLTLLGGKAALWLWDDQIQPRVGFSMSYRHAYIISGAGAVIALGLALVNQPLRGIVPAFFPPAYATAADVDALRWMRENTAENAIILNFPAIQEGAWTPIIAERPSAFYPPIPFSGQPSPPDELLSFWTNPANMTNLDRLQAVGIEYVFIPQIALDTARRGDFWRDPGAVGWPEFNVAAIANAPYLEAVYGDQVYRVVVGDDDESD